MYYSLYPNTRQQVYINISYLYSISRAIFNYFFIQFREIPACADSPLMSHRCSQASQRKVFKIILCFILFGNCKTSSAPHLRLVLFRKFEKPGWLLSRTFPDRGLVKLLIARGCLLAFPMQCTYVHTLIRDMRKCDQMHTWKTVTCAQRWIRRRHKGHTGPFGVRI